MPLQLLNACSHALQAVTYKAKQMESSLRDARHVCTGKESCTLSSPPSASRRCGSQGRAVQRLPASAPGCAQSGHARHYRYPHKHGCDIDRHCCPCDARQCACPASQRPHAVPLGFVMSLEPSSRTTFAAQAYGVHSGGYVEADAGLESAGGAPQQGQAYVAGQTGPHHRHSVADTGAGEMQVRCILYWLRARLCAAPC